MTFWLYSTPKTSEIVQRISTFSLTLFLASLTPLSSRFLVRTNRPTPCSTSPPISALYRGPSLSSELRSLQRVSPGSLSQVRTAYNEAASFAQPADLVSGWGRARYPGVHTLTSIGRSLGRRRSVCRSDGESRPVATAVLAQQCPALLLHYQCM